VSAIHSIDYCPLCGGGLCGIRICGLNSPDDVDAPPPHGLVICDECEAIWLEPDVTSDHQYPAAENACCPVCSLPIWSRHSRWAQREDIESLGWSAAVNEDLHYPG
jgi:hypothetical protein